MRRIVLDIVSLAGRRRIVEVMLGEAVDRLMLAEAPQMIKELAEKMMKKTGSCPGEGDIDACITEASTLNDM